MMVYEAEAPNPRASREIVNGKEDKHGERTREHLCKNRGREWGME